MYVFVECGQYKGARGRPRLNWHDFRGPHPYPAHSPAAVATADGKLSSSGVPQRLTLVVLRRDTNGDAKNRGLSR